MTQAAMNVEIMVSYILFDYFITINTWGFSKILYIWAVFNEISYTMNIGSFPGAKRPLRGVDYPPPFWAEVKDRVELYLETPLCLHGVL